MLLIFRECAFFVKESKLQTFKWKTGNILHSKISPKHWGYQFLLYPGH